MPLIDATDADYAAIDAAAACCHYALLRRHYKSFARHCYDATG